MCKNDKDCYGNGYCQARKCKCLDNYEYAHDCSHYGCKYIQQNFVFLSTVSSKVPKHIFTYCAGPKLNQNSFFQVKKIGAECFGICRKTIA